MFAIATGLAWKAGGGSHSAQSMALLNQPPESPRITLQPEDQAIWVGSDVTFKVGSDNGERFQWTRNGVALPGQTNHSLSLAKVSVSDVGIYSCSVSKGTKAVSTQSATLNVLLDGGGSIIIFGTVLVGSGGQGSDCPGPYVGYVNFSKPVTQGWGWAPTPGASVHEATDPNRTDTHIVYLGRFADTGCGATSVEVNPVISPRYRFTVFFPSNVPTGTYAIVLTGFNP